MNQKGLGMVEIIVVIAVIIVAFTAILQLFRLEIRTERVRREELRAYALLSEAMEAARSVRDDEWSNLSTLTPGVDYYSTIQDGSWILSGTDPGQINGYSRWVVLSQVQRDANDDIVSSGGTLDPDTLLVTGYVEWQSGGETKNRSLATYLTNWQEEL